MDIQYTGKHTTITDAMKSYAEKKLSRLSPFTDFIKNVHITFSVDQLDQTVQATINVTSQTLHASSTAHDIYAALDDLTDKIVRQLKKHKEKTTSH